MSTAHGSHVPHIHVPYPHVGSPDDQAHREETKHSALGGTALGIGVVIALIVWATAFVALINSGPSRTTSGMDAVWTALAISSGFSLFMMGIWKAYRA